MIICSTPSGCTCGAPASTPRGMHLATCSIRSGASKIHPQPPITTEVVLPQQWVPCTNCGLHYIVEGREPDRRRCNWFLEEVDQA